MASDRVTSINHNHRRHDRPRFCLRGFRLVLFRGFAMVNQDSINKCFDLSLVKDVSPCMLARRHDTSAAQKMALENLKYSSETEVTQ
jgi:hypothetical protein